MTSAQANLEASPFLEIKGLVKEYTPGNPILKGIDITTNQESLPLLVLQVRVKAPYYVVLIG